MKQLLHWPSDFALTEYASPLVAAWREGQTYAGDHSYSSLQFILTPLLTENQDLMASAAMEPSLIKSEPVWKPMSPPF